MADKEKTLIPKSEQDKISRSMMAWVNTYPSLPDILYNGIVNYENLASDKVCMALSTIQGTHIVERNIAGGYTAEYQFKLIYRIKPGTSNDKRLDADETLDAIADWASVTLPNLGAGINVLDVEATSRSSMFAIYDNGDEDHQILMKMTYEVI